MTSRNRRGHDTDPPPKAADPFITSWHSSAQDPYNSNLAQLQLELQNLAQRVQNMTNQQSPLPVYGNFNRPLLSTQPSRRIHEISPSPTRLPPKPRNIPNERSRYSYYAVRNGRCGNEVCSNWPEAAKQCWDTTRNSFIHNSSRKGFHTYNEASSFLYKFQKEQLQLDTRFGSQASIPEEPPSCADDSNYEYDHRPHDTPDIPTSSHSSLIIGINDMNKTSTYIDASYAVHPNMRSHTGGLVSMGTGILLGNHQSRNSMSRAPLKQNCLV